MLNDLAYGNPGILDGERPSEGHVRTLPAGTSRERQNWNAAGVRIGDYEISSGRLIHHDYPEAMQALEACAVRRGCQNEQR